MASDIRIRRYEPRDESALRRIDFETGFFGESMSPLLDDRRIFDRALDVYLADEPVRAFVVERDVVEGYVVASDHDVSIATAAMHLRGFLYDFARWPWLSRKDRRYVVGRLHAALRTIRGPERRFRFPRGPRLHVNLLASLRGEGIGSELLQVLLYELKLNGAGNVHANAYESERLDNSGFWKSNGFVEYSRVRTSAWREFGVAEDVDLVCYVRELK